MSKRIRVPYRRGLELINPKCLCSLIADKQQEVDIATLRVAQTDNSSISPGGERNRKDAGTSSGMASTPTTAQAASSASMLGQDRIRPSAAHNKSENHAQDASESMSQISGFRRSLSHANSLPGGESVPKFGVSTEKETELAEVCNILTVFHQIHLWYCIE